MVAARVRDGGGAKKIPTNYSISELPSGKPSDTYLQILEEVQTISRATLFSPVTRHEAVQAMSK
jgi:hypothetical protein